MAIDKPTVKKENAYFLKGHASWLYCDSCNKTVAYLCYVTYSYFKFSFQCKCGCNGSVENRYDETDASALPAGELKQSDGNKRYCCAKDNQALFSPVPKNLIHYSAIVICKQCNSKYTISETY